MRIKYEVWEPDLIVWVPRELDHHYADVLRNEVEVLMHIHHVRNIIFDFSETDFMDSSGIGVLIGRCKKLSYQNGVVYARNLNGRVKKIFQASGLEKIIEVISEDAK